MTDLISTIKILRPSAQVSVNAEDINQITWHDGNPTNITNQQILDKQEELNVKNAYIELRRKEYPNHEDCIHALLDGGDALTDLQAKRTAIKNKYLKA